MGNGCLTEGPLVWLVSSGQGDGPIIKPAWGLAKVLDGNPSGLLFMLPTLEGQRPSRTRERVGSELGLYQRFVVGG